MGSQYLQGRGDPWGYWLVTVVERFEAITQRLGGFMQVECQLHRYYGATCRCGPQTQATPGQGECFEVAGQKRQL